MEIKYCPICMSEMEDVTTQSHYCKFCKTVFYITMTCAIDNPCLIPLDNERE